MARLSPPAKAALRTALAVERCDLELALAAMAPGDERWRAAVAALNQAEAEHRAAVRAWREDAGAPRQATRVGRVVRWYKRRIRLERWRRAPAPAEGVAA